MDGIGQAIEGLMWVALVQIPLSILGIWKLVEIIVWIFKHIHISIG